MQGEPGPPPRTFLRKSCQYDRKNSQKQPPPGLEKLAKEDKFRDIRANFATIREKNFEKFN